jgi:hypothetical protein
MSGSAIAPRGGGLVGPLRIVPPLPAGISILPGQVTAAKAKRRLPVGLIVVLVIAGLGGLEWFNIYYSGYDSQRIDPVVRQAVLAHVPKGTRIPVTLWSGPRLIEIATAFPERQPGQAPDTIVLSYVIDPKTGAKDPKYANGTDTVIEGVAITIR